MIRSAPIPFFTDQNVADSVGATITELSHDLTRLRTVLATDTQDPLVALACADGGHVLVSHDPDFKAIARRFGLTQREQRKHLHRIDLRCFEPLAAGRIREAMSLIESEWQIALSRNAPMVIEIREQSIRTNR
jgi:predicted nuclease of predicted toxin-antitoxin system